ncbi:MAG TPA: hypothetical protein VGB95_06950 [Chitinophagales bacterium]
MFESQETLDRIGKLESSRQLIETKLSSVTTQLEAKLSSISTEQVAIQNQVKEIQKGAPEYEVEAQQASQNAIEYAQKSKEVLEKINSVFDEIDSNKTSVQTKANEVAESTERFNSEYQKIVDILGSFKERESELLKSIASLEEKISSVEGVFQKHPNINSEIESIETLLSQIQDVDSKSSQLMKTITTRKNEIDRLHNEIIGFTDINPETNEETHISGLKDELQNSYNGLTEKLDVLNNELQLLNETTNGKYNSFIEASSQDKEQTFKRWEDNYDNLKDKINKLLPNALTAGLSYAFADKKNDEVKAYTKHKTQFGWGIGGMIVVSSITVGISIYFLATGVKIEDVIDRIPRIVLGILPLYVPVLWLTISASKKMNLSKRLIEEYSHKEVLSKTFEGLSTQIEKIGTESVSTELRMSLLDNFLEMYSQNPGRLISDYNNSDHPLMELLETANKLENSVGKIDKIPGMRKIAKILERKATDKIIQATERVERSIDKALDLAEETVN